MQHFSIIRTILKKLPRVNDVCWRLCGLRRPWSHELFFSLVVSSSFFQEPKWPNKNSLLLHLLWLQLYWFTISIHLFSYNQNPLNLNNLAWLFKEVFFPRLCVLSVDKCVYICLIRYFSSEWDTLHLSLQICRNLKACPLKTVCSMNRQFDRYVQEMPCTSSPQRSLWFSGSWGGSAPSEFLPVRVLIYGNLEPRGFLSQTRKLDSSWDLFIQNRRVNRRWD